MGPYLKTLLLLMGGQVVGQVGAAMLSAKIDPLAAGAAPQGNLPVGGGATRGDELAMLAGGGGSLYLAGRLKSPEARVFAVGVAMGALAPVTQALAQAVAKRVVAA